MKTKLLFLCCALCVALHLSASDSGIIDGIFYDFDTETYTASVTYPWNGKCYSGEIIIPSYVVYSYRTYKVTSIGCGAFCGCSSLTSITIPNSVTEIGIAAFEGCSSLTAITIPSSVTSVGRNAFYNCSGLTSLVVESGNTTYDSRNNCNAIIQTESNTLIIGCNNTTNIESVTNIGDFAFSGCTGLTSITIPNSVQSIGDNAFIGCTGLASITIPNSVASIGSSAFGGCTGLTSATIGDSVTSIMGGAFNGCTSLTSITIPNSVTSIENYVFQNCTSLTSITIPNSVTEIGLSAFKNCSSLTSITIPKSVADIESKAFMGCTGLTSITIPNSVEWLGSETFSGCSSLKSITISESVTSIKSDVFNDCKSLSSITIPNSVTSIEDYAFRNCTGLTSVTVGNSVTTIKRHVFSGCNYLKSVTLGKAIKTIEDGAFYFYNYRHLKYITCYAPTPPTIYDNTFWTDNTLYVPCESIELYKQSKWRAWSIPIECIVEAEESEVSTTTATPSTTDVTIAWPIKDGVWSYIWTITKNGEVVYTLTFNANGQLMDNAFAPSRNGVAQAQAAELTATGYQFTVTGLESNSTYAYLMKVKDFEDNTIETFSGNFTTDDPTELESVVSNKNVQKILRDGHIFIQRDGKTYNMQGAVVNL